MTVLVTGAASGIGRATASRVARAAGKVIAVDVWEERLDELRLSLPETLIIGVAADITTKRPLTPLSAQRGKKLTRLPTSPASMTTSLLCMKLRTPSGIASSAST